ncbi:MAG: elongation factor G [Ignavibacteriaceae bacterium]|jgi:elongation factor G|nr:MAG: elongation factor G [Chlorobiota bacterium]KXK06056.1 MAG: translation elongation factor G [Chlorobi bacterium OLB4]MBV6398491.1 Elongation factor G [Ignavibacteria bacterium]MCC6885725.1 elongation factor G [Ignavibacteriales bacterium]MCE7953080.1 elongation factor G [Chlorobi bacterium CHB7]MDL1887082.1 elongation factor G [Ignavibacteria bacterium CHB1]MEB2329137.1 elongation factor G [Ignavibacteriaceae bacterium]OQY77975.1 MAG: elongation factor G [Ignavibacteriales bacterium U
MPEYTTSQIRNISLIGHSGTGKTLLAEAILFSTGAINRMGSIEEGNTVSDYHKDEIEKQMSINSSLLNTIIQNNKGEKLKLNILDTPGFMDFIGEVVSSLRVTDTSLVVVDASKGREVGTEISFRYTDYYKNDIIFVVNKTDHENIDFENVVSQLKEGFGNRVTVIQFPVNSGGGFSEVIDVMKMKLLKYSKDGKGNYTIEDIPDNLKAKADEYHQAFIETIAEEDEELMTKYFDQGTLSDEDLDRGLKIGLSKREIFPLFCTSASSNVGIRGLLEFIAEYCESLLDSDTESGFKPGTEDLIEIKHDPKGEPVMFIFKTVSEKNIGELSFFRVYSGSVRQGLDLVNGNNGMNERLSQLYTMQGKDRKEIPEVICGDIASVVKLKHTHTNNTLSSKNLPVVVKGILFPDPNISMAISAKNKGDEDKLSVALHSFHEEDPSFSSNFDTQTNQTIISGQGEIHLQTIVQRMHNKYGLEVDVTEPRIPYRETIRSTVNDSEYKHKKQSGGRGQYGHVHIKIEPLERGNGFEFVNAIVGGVVPGRFIPAVEKGIVEIMEKGILVGSKVVDVKVTLFDGTFHNVDSDEISFKIAGSQAFKKGFKDASPVLLEPIYNVEVVFPEEFMGAVSGDVSSRRGRIMGMESEGHLQLIKAQMPLSEMEGYSSKLRSLTQGRGTYKRKFSHYEEVPKEIEVKIIDNYEKNKSEE